MITSEPATPRRRSPTRPLGRLGHIPSDSMDVLFRGATVYDGSGAEGVRQDVAVRGERVMAVGDGAERISAASVIDADGLALAPGFIAMHSHADHTLPANPAATNSITQGVTTELIGLCGFSVAPVSLEPTKASQLRDMAAGIEHVIMGGEFAVEHGRPTRLDLGQVLRARQPMEQRKS